MAEIISNSIIGPGVATAVVAASYTPMVTVGVASYILIGSVIAVNDAISSDTLELWVVPSGESTTAPVGEYQVMRRRVVADRSQQCLDAPIIAKSGDTIVAKSSSASGMTVRLQYQEFNN